MSNVVISFARSVKDSSNDDVIVITPTWSKCSNDVSVLEYSVVMTTAPCANDTNHNKEFAQTLSVSNLGKYLHALFALMPCDTEPFVRVQVDLPNAPSVVFEQKALYYNSWCILNLIEVSLKSWIPQSS